MTIRETEKLIKTYSPSEKDSGLDGFMGNVTQTQRHDYSYAFKFLRRIKEDKWLVSSYELIITMIQKPDKNITK